MELFVTSIIAFASTNIDDIFLLVLFFGTRRFTERTIIVGQFVGISTLIAISLVGLLAGLFISKPYIGFLGFIPVYLGIKGIRAVINAKESEGKDTVENLVTKSNGILAVAGVTIANGGDNIGIYIPLFNSLIWKERLVMIIVFLVMTAVWCLIAKYLVKHPLISRTIERYGHIVTPFVLILLGIYILYESKTFQLFLNVK